MNKIECLGLMVRHRAVGVLITGVLTVAFHGDALAVLQTLEHDQLLVRELMRLDSEQALAMAREHVPSAVSLSEPVRRTIRSMSGAPRLSAIYGTGKQLMAEVRVDDDVYLYRSGQALPVGVAADDDVYVLQRITASCVDLRNADHTHQLCLPSTPWAGQ